MKICSSSHRRGALIIAAFFAGSALFAPAHAQTTVTANPAADAFVTTGPTNNLTANNYGAAGALAISGAAALRTGVGAQGTFDSVMRFDLSGAKASFDAAHGSGLWSVQSVTLRLTTSSVNSAIFNSNTTGQFNIVWMQDDGWTEGTGMPNAPTTSGVTFASLPGFLGSGDQSLGTFAFDNSASGADGANSTYTLNLAGPDNGFVNDVLTGQLASLEFLAASGATSYLFNSGNFTTASRRPVLSITAVAVPEPGAALLLMGGCMFLAAVWRTRSAHAPC